MFRFIKTTVLGGILFILPLVLIFVLVEKAIHILRPPVQKVLPVFSGYDVAGVTLIGLATFVGLLFLCFLAGLLARTAVAIRTLETIEGKVLGNLPGYQLLKDSAARLTGLENDTSTQVGMIREGDGEGWRLCLVLESDDGWSVIFMPDGGPAGGTAGEVRIVPAGEVVITELSSLALLTNLRRGGRGVLELLKPSLPKRDT